MNSKDAIACLLTTATTYVIIVFCRTFSNFLEMIFFAWLIILATAPNTSYRSRTWLLTGLIVTTTFFIRPTFLIFAFWPVVSMLFQQGKDLFTDNLFVVSHETQLG